jgi:hypothetical protein
MRKGWDKEQSLRLGVAKIYDPVANPRGDPVYRGFKTADQFWEIISEMPYSKEKIYIFAHNIGFDLRIVEWFRRLAGDGLSLFPPAGSPGEGRYKRPLCIIDGHPVILRCFRRDGQQILCLDSINWWFTSLREIGDWIGDPKGEMPDPTAEDDAWFGYCQQDVDVLDKALRRLWGWLQCMRIPSFEATPAAQAMILYRQRYERKRIVRPEDTAVLALDRHGYYGGLVECYRIGRIERTLHQVDVTGLYPAVMRGNPYPCEVIDQRPKGRVPVDRSDIDPRYATAEVWLQSKRRCYPVRASNGTYWVTGKVRTILCGPELERAWSAGDVRHVGRATIYRLDDLFSGFVGTYWSLRERAKSRGDAMIDRTCKLLLNALHGKFGQRDGGWVYVGDNPRPGAFGAGKVVGPKISQDVDYRIIAGKEFYRVRDEEHERGFVPIAAWTASYGRVQMAEWRDLAGPDDVVYQAVDSLIVTGDGLGRLQLSGCVGTGQLGHFHYERDYEWLHVHGVNQLDWPGGMKSAGLRKGSVEIAGGIYETEEWEPLGSGVCGGNVSSVGTRKQYKKRSTYYGRRAIGADGKTVPFTIDNWSVPPDQMVERPIDTVLVRGE